MKYMYREPKAMDEVANNGNDRSAKAYALANDVDCNEMPRERGDGLVSKSHRGL